MKSTQRATYGIDAPTDVIRFACISLGGVVLGPLLAALAPRWRGPAQALLSIGVWFGVVTLVMIWSSLFGKMRTRDWLLAQHAWRGDEQVLDAGCGRGLMLIGAAHRLTSGHAIGVDLWQQSDQSGNGKERTLANVEAEQVADRVTIETGDLRSLVHPDASFDVITSSFVLHNIHPRAERKRALLQLVRVLKEEGQLLLVDILHGGEYATILREAGLDVRRSFPTLLFGLPTFKIVATRPPRK